MKKHYKFIVGIIVGLILSSVIGYAKTVLTSNEVVYDNTNSKLSSTNVKDAIDELNEKATTKLDEAKQTCPDGYECNKVFTPKYFAYGTPTTKSTTDYTTLGHNVFAALDIDGTTGGVCIDDGALFCIRANDYENNLIKLKKYFGESECTNGDDNINCHSIAFNCVASSNGNVECYNHGSGGQCYAYADGSFSCS